MTLPQAALVSLHDLVEIELGAVEISEHDDRRSRRGLARCRDAVKELLRAAVAAAEGARRRPRLVAQLPPVADPHAQMREIP